MNTIIYDLLTENNNEIYEKAGQIIRNGGIVAFPTETVYGIGANAFDCDAVKKIFLAKGRPNDNPLIAHISDKSQFNNLASEINDDAKRLIDFFMPGAITLIVKSNAKVAKEATCNLDTVGIRMPSNEYANKFLAACKVPVVAPSANISGFPSGTRAKYVIEDFNGKIDAILSGGDCDIGVESTVIDVSTNTPKLLRPGGVSIEEIQSVLGKEVLYANKADALRPKSPGMKYTHYKPKAEVIIFSGKEDNKVKFLNSLIKDKKNIGILAFDNILKELDKNAISLSLGQKDDITNAAKVLFSSLRKFDELKVDTVYCEAVNTEGIGFAYMNRLLKSAGGKHIKL